MIKIPLLLLTMLLIPSLPCSAEDAPLKKEMESLDTVWKQIRREKDPAKGAELARTAQKHLTTALDQTPAILSKIPAGPQREAAAQKYRKLINDSLQLMRQIEQAYMANDLAQVSKLRESMLKIKEQGHNEFIEEDE